MLAWLKATDSRFSELFDAADEEGEESVLDHIVSLYCHLPTYSSFDSERVKRMVRSSNAPGKLPVMNRGTGLLVKWAIARYADHLLFKVTAQNSDVSIGGTGWLRFIAHGLHLSSSITELKIDFFLAQAALQIANRNEVGAAICARSLVEHMAAQEWMVTRIEKNWEEIKKRVQKGSLSESHLMSIDKDLAIFLTGTKSTAESPREWDGSWRSGGKGALQVLTLVEDMAPSHKLSYDYFSGVIHGRLIRGLELTEHLVMPSRASPTLFDALSNANEVCASLEEQTRAMRSAVMSSRFVSLAANMEGGEANARLLEKATLAMSKLKPNAHYFGVGTVEEPYRFREGIPYHEAFIMLCAQLELNPEAIQSFPANDGFLDMVSMDGHETYFFRLNSSQS